MEKRKNETIANLETNFYKGGNNQEEQLLKDEISKLKDLVNDLKNKNELLESAIQEQND